MSEFPCEGKNEEHGSCLEQVLGKSFGPRWDEVANNWRKLHDEKLHILCISPNIVGVIKSTLTGMCRPQGIW